MIYQDYDLDADALYVRLSSGTVASTVEVDSGTLADLDHDGALVGIEIIRPHRIWPLDEIITRFGVSGLAERELRAYFPQPPDACRYEPSEHPAQMPPRTMAQPAHPEPGVRVAVRC